MSNQTLLTIASTAFILLGAYNLFTAARRAREANMRGETFKWFKQTNALVGIEYLLLAWVFLLSNLYSSKTLPSNLKSIVIPLYLFCLVAAAVFLGLVIHRVILNTRIMRYQARSNAGSASSIGTRRVVEASASVEMSEQERTVSFDRRRERRKNAASARRRRAGKA